MKIVWQQYVPPVYRFALRLTGSRDAAEELTQDTLLQAWRHRRRLRDPGSARAWLFQIAANLWRDRLRQQQRRGDLPNVDADEHPDAAASAQQKASDREDVQRALAAMDRLPPRQREVLYLHACEQMPLEEIAEVLEISSDAVKASLSLARKRVRRELKDVCRDRFPST